MESLEPLLTVKEVADYLEVPVATIYVWRYRREGPPGFRVGRHLRFRWCDVENWITRQFHPPQPCPGSDNHLSQGRHSRCVPLNTIRRGAEPIPGETTGGD